MRYARPERCPEDGGELVERVTEHGGRILRECSTCTVRQWCDTQGRPTGTPGNAFLRRARWRAHEAFDRIWEHGHMSRKEAYAWLQAAMDSPVAVHVGELGTEECLRVEHLSVEKLRSLESPDVRTETETQ